MADSALQAAIHAARQEAERLHYPPLDDRVTLAAIAAYRHETQRQADPGKCGPCKSNDHRACTGGPCNCTENYDRTAPPFPGSADG